MTAQHPLEADRRFVTTTAGEVSYLDTAPDGAPGKDGRTVLFVHGIGTSAYLWRNAIAGLRGEHRCVAVDLPLHGHTPAAPGQDFSLGAVADVVGAFCAAAGLDHLDVVAHDTGGAITQIFAARNPHLLTTLTLTNCDTHDNVPPPEFAPTVELARAGKLAPNAPALLEDIAAARAAVYEMGYDDPSALPDDMVRAYLQPLVGTKETALAFERWIAGLEPSDLLAVEDDLRRLRVPTLVVWGTGDAFFDVSWAYWLRDTIPGVTEVVELAGAKLFYPDERAAELVPHLRRHWAAHPAAQPTQPIQPAQPAQPAAAS